MYTKAAFLANITQQTAIIKHLHSKVTPAALDYRASAKQRSTRQLLAHLGCCAVGITDCLISSDWAVYDRWEIRAEEATFAELPAVYDAQAAGIARLLAPFSDFELGNTPKKLQMGGPCSLGEALVHWPLAWLNAYKMQLFLNLKVARPELNSSNLWAGKDPEPRKVAASA